MGIYQIYLEKFFLIQFVLCTCILELSFIFLEAATGNLKRREATDIVKNQFSYWKFRAGSLRTALVIAAGTTVCLFLPLSLFGRLMMGMIFSFVICIFLAWHYQKYTAFGFQRLLLTAFAMASLVGSMNALFHDLLGRGNAFYLFFYSYISTVILKWLIVKYFCMKKQLIYSVCLENDGKQIELKAFLDTGNGLIEPISQKAVSIVEGERLEDIKTENTAFRVVPYRSMGRKKGILYAYEIDAITIETDFKKIRLEKVFVAEGNMNFHEKKKYEMILHPMLLN